MMKRNKFQVNPDELFGTLQERLRKMLQLEGSGASLFLYIHSSFVPGPEEVVGDLAELFSVRGELLIHYCLQEAWG